MKDQRGGGRRGWDRLWRARASEHHDPEPDPVPEGGIPNQEPETVGQVETQASFDQVLRHASEARETSDDNKA